MTTARLNEFESWLKAVREFATRPGRELEQKLSPLKRRISEIECETRRLSLEQQKSLLSAEAKCRRFASFGLGFLCDFAWFTTLIGANSRLASVDISTQLSRLSAERQSLQGRIHATEQTFPGAGRLAFWKELDVNLPGFVAVEWRKLNAHPFIAEVVVIDSWLRVTTTELTCHAYDDLENVHALGSFAIWLMPGSLPVVRNLAGPREDEEGNLWHAPHVQEGYACFGDNQQKYENDLLCGRIFSLVKLLIANLGVAGNDAWGTPILELFPPVVNCDRA